MRTASETYRRYRRIEVNLQVEIWTHKDRIPAVTTDVSQGGLNIQAPETWEVGTWLCLLVQHPDFGTRKLWAVVKRCSADWDGWATHGLELAGNQPSDMITWREIVRTLAITEARTWDSDRHVVQWYHWAETLEELEYFLDHDLLDGSSFWRTSAPPSEGAPVDVVFTHPLSQKRYAIRGMVEEHGVSDGSVGAWVRWEFIDINGFEEFLHQGLPWKDICDDLITLIEQGKTLHNPKQPTPFDLWAA